MTDHVSDGAAAAPGDLGVLIAALQRLSETIDLVRSDLERGSLLLAREQLQDVGSEPGRCFVLRRNGEYWIVGREGQTSSLRDCLGLRYLARLMAEPGRELHALDLVAQRPAGTSLETRAQEGLDRSDDEPLVDATARAAYRGRLAELEAEREEIRSADARLAGGMRLEAIELEIDALRQELARAYGLGGRPRHWVSEAERARQRVSKAIHGAIGRILLNDEEVGSHLRHAVRTGTYCAYDPEPGSSVRWCF